MKNLLLFIIIALFSIPVFSQNWTQRQSLNSARHNTHTFSIKGKGYLAMGIEAGTYQNDLWEYDPSTNSWGSKSNFIGSPRSDGFSFSIGNVGYIGGGWNANTTFSDFYEYNPATDTWTQKANYPGTGGRNSFGTAVNGKAYVGGGAFNGNTPYQTDFWEYDPVTDTWSSKGNFPFGPRATGVSFTIDTLAYFGLGHNNVNSFTDLWAYNPALNTWTQMADFPGNDRTQASYFVINGKAIVGGGFQLPGGPQLSDYFEYDPGTNSWAQINNFANGTRSNSRGFAINDTGYVCTGKDGNSSQLSDLWAYYSDRASSIEKETIDIKMTLFPVPNSGDLTISYTTKDAFASFTLYNIKGQLILTQKVDRPGNQMKVDLSDLPLGNYTYTFKIAEGVKSGIIPLIKK